MWENSKPGALYGKRIVLIKPGENGSINIELEGDEHYRFAVTADMGSFTVRLQRLVPKEGKHD